MDRRFLLKLAALSGLAAQPSSRLLGQASAVPNSSEQPAEQPPVRTVLLVTKCHLDVGFTKTQAKVLQQYFEVYFPAAMKIASDLRQAGGDRYRWTTGSWLLYEYLEQASPAQRRQIESAVAVGDLAYHGLPLNWQTEMIDRSMIAGSMGFAAELDRRFGRKTIAGKMTDVPGHTRGLIAPLSAGGIRMLDIGVNAASTPPDVPDVFLWKDAAGNSLAMLYHRHDYGGVLVIPGTDVAVDVEVRGDNSGPHTPAEIAAIYARLRAQFPGAEVRASTLNEVAAVVDRVRDRLPVVKEEIGDTWIYGCASDPVKVARYRAVARLRQGWIAKGSFATGDVTDRALLRRLLLAPEHTWGTDTKTYLDDLHYRPAALAMVVHQPAYEVMETSWAEKRADIDLGVQALPDTLQREAIAHLATLGAARPLGVQGTLGRQSATLAGMQAHDPQQPIETRQFSLRLDPATGAIVGLRRRNVSWECASVDQPLALFTYQTLSAAEYSVFLQGYLKTKADWAPRDFGKPGIEALQAVAASLHPRMLALWTRREPEGDRVVAQLAMENPDAQATGNDAWPAEMWLELYLPAKDPRIDLELVTLGKVQNRMPEAMWLSFHPAQVEPGSWRLEKSGESVDPFGVVAGGGRQMHAVSGPVSCRGPAGASLSVAPLDTPVVALGKRSPLNFSLEQPDLTQGIHFSLFNNAWGTNYLQWAGGDWSFRFTLRA